MAWLAIAGLFQQGDFERSSSLIERTIACSIPPRSRVHLLVGRARVALQVSQLRAGSRVLVIPFGPTWPTMWSKIPEYC